MSPKSLDSRLPLKCLEALGPHSYMEQSTEPLSFALKMGHMGSNSTRDQSKCREWWLVSQEPRGGGEGMRLQLVGGRKGQGQELLEEELRKHPQILTEVGKSS